MPYLYIYPKEGEFQKFLLSEKKISIGRSSENDIPLPDPFCSGKHAFIYRGDSGFVLRNNQSKNGMFVNGKRIVNEVELKKGDEILIGTTRVVFDREISSNVEMTDSASHSANVNTIMNLDEVLKKHDISTTIKSAKPVDFEQVKLKHRLLAIINDVNKALLLHMSLTDLLEHIMDRISEHISMDRGILMLKEGNPAQLIPKVIRINNDRLKNEKIHVSQSIVNMAINKHSSLLISDVQDDSRFKSQDSILKMNIKSAMCVPLYNNKEIIGIIYADRISLLKPFADDDLELLTLLSNLAAVKIEHSILYEQSIAMEKLEKELELAAQIQRDFLPKENPKCRNFDIAGANFPCYQVGGDFYDFIPIDPERLGITIADVSGKGVSASLLMASMRARLHAEINPHIILQEMAKKLNDFVHKDTASSAFITFFFGALNIQTGELEYLNAGHTPPVIMNKKGKVRRLESGGFCLGMFPSVGFEIQKCFFDIGDTALFFTDGLTECRNSANEDFKEEGLIDLLAKYRKLSAQKLLEKIYEDLDLFTSDMEQMDDMTLVIVKRIF
ncbi:MAG: SpoIIE family protein phosphatase [Candidatus Aminicenantes bacterium]|nr:SpoIIE family protein phosphatase [Candidatus Aminicenantes bacterium]